MVSEIRYVPKICFGWTWSVENKPKPTITFYPLHFISSAEILNNDYFYSKVYGVLQFLERFKTMPISPFWNFSELKLDNYGGHLIPN